MKVTYVVELVYSKGEFKAFKETRVTVYGNSVEEVAYNAQNKLIDDINKNNPALREVAEFADFCYYAANVTGESYLSGDFYKLAGTVKLGGN